MKKFVALLIATLLVGCAKAGDAFNGTWVSKDGSTAVIDEGLCSTYNSRHELQASARLLFVNNTTADFPTPYATFRIVLMDQSTLETFTPGSSPLYLHRVK